MSAPKQAANGRWYVRDASGKTRFVSGPKTKTKTKTKTKRAPSAGPHKWAWSRS